MADGSDAGEGDSGRIPWGDFEYFVLLDREPVKAACEHGGCATCWANWMARWKPRVGDTALSKARWVMTEFLGIQGPGSPSGLFFWTTISRLRPGPDRADYILEVETCAYVATWGEAEAAHARAVKRAHVEAFPERYA